MIDSLKHKYLTIYMNGLKKKKQLLPWNLLNCHIVIITPKQPPEIQKLLLKLRKFVLIHSKYLFSQQKIYHNRRAFHVFIVIIKYGRRIV